MSYITIPPVVSINEPVLITIVTSNPIIATDVFLPNGLNVVISGYTQTIVADEYKYEVYFTPTLFGTYLFRYQSYEEGFIQAYFEAVGSTNGKPTIVNYPSRVQQMQSFNWSIEFGKPGETVTVIEDGPVTITRSTVMEARGYNVGYNNFTSQFQYAGTYTVTCNFSRSASVSTSVTVSPKIHLVYPSSVVANEGYSYSISGGNPNEPWTGVVSGPSSFSIGGILDGNGAGTFSSSVPSGGSYNVDFTFSQSGNYKQSFTAVPNTRNGIHGPGTPIAFSEVHAEFLVGYDLDTYRNRRWYLSLDDPSWDSNQGLGNFSSYDLSFYQFYNKKAIDPVVPGQTYYGNPGSYEWTVPANRNGITIEGWGAGGGTYGGGFGGSTVISAGNYYMVAGGGETAAGGGRRYGAPPGAGGTASGGDVNINGEGGSWSSPYGNGGRGGNSPFGGTGGAERGVNTGSNSGNAPGGGSSGNSSRDYSKYPGWGFSSGGGGGAYTRSTVPLKRGNVISFTVGFGYSGGAHGAVRLTWS